MDNEIQEKQEEDSGRSFYEWIQALVCSVLAVVLVFTFGIRLIGVDGHSMVPTLQNADRLLVANPFFYHHYKYGDNVNVHKGAFADGRPIVKRVIATGGQTVNIDFNTGTVTVDGKALKESYINELTRTPEGTKFPLRVPKESVFVMGDNRNNSNDSRNPQLGTVDTRYIIGRAFFMAFPGPDINTDKRIFSRIGVLA